VKLTEVLKAKTCKDFRGIINTLARAIFSWYYPRPDCRSIVVIADFDNPDFPAPAASYHPERLSGHCGQMALFWILISKSAHPECDAMPHKRPLTIY
jgi:hypothetical protein